MVSRRDSSEPSQWSFPSLSSDLLSAIQTRGSVGPCSWVENRVIGLLATPAAGNASKMAVGVSGLPAGTTTAEHNHEAEELAIVIAGDGEITIDGQTFSVGPGSVVLTPSWASHVTKAAETTELLILWVYAPAGSEKRWLAMSTANSKSTEAK